MCLGTPQLPSGGGQMPAPPPPPPTPVDPAVSAAGERMKQRAAAATGYASTIKTGGSGIVTPAYTSANAGKTLLGM